MKHSRFARLVIAFVAFSGLALQATEYRITGVVRAVLSPQELVIAHEDIPGFMPAMTMAFTLRTPGAAEGIAVDDRVEGVIVTGEGPMVLTRLRKIGTASAPTSRAGRASVVRLDEGDTVPSFDLVNQDDEAITVVATGRPTLLTFVFTRCPIKEFCPLMSERFVSFQTAIQENQVKVPLRLLSVTLDPEFDTPSVLKTYGGYYEADPAIWEFATGEPTAIEHLVRSFRVFRERNGALLDHTLCTALIDADGVVRQIWRGNRWTTDEILTAVNALKPTEVAQH